jgi:Ca2+-binding EF-hand superfamily protein
MPEHELNSILTEAGHKEHKITFEEFCKIMQEGDDKKIEEFIKQSIVT